MKKIVIGVLFGGKSTEHKVSMLSARSVVDALDKDKYEVVPLALTRDNTLLTMGTASREDVKKGGETVLGRQSILAEDKAISLAALDRSIVDIVFPVMHGNFGEDGRLQGFLELLDIPFVGSGVLGSALGMDKIAQKRMMYCCAIPVMEWVCFTQHDWDTRTDEMISLVEGQCGYPCFVKPSNSGSSIGINKARNATELEEFVLTALQYDTKIIVEEALKDPREIEVAVRGHNDFMITRSVAEIRTWGDFYDFETKYDPDSDAKVTIPADITEEQYKTLCHYTLLICQILDISGLARVDFFMNDEGKIYFNEINTLPGFTANSAYAKMWQADGLSYSNLLDDLITYALRRDRERKRLHYEA